MYGSFKYSSQVACNGILSKSCLNDFSGWHQAVEMQPCLCLQVYSIEDSPLCLTGTAEVPLAGIHMDTILPAAALPLRLAGYGRAFRTEAGAAGSASRGLYRLHQFSKVCPSKRHVMMRIKNKNHETKKTQYGLPKRRGCFSLFARDCVAYCDP